jgi:hypothetical protein
MEAAKYQMEAAHAQLSGLKIYIKGLIQYVDFKFTNTKTGFCPVAISVPQ